MLRLAVIAPLLGVLGCAHAHNVREATLESLAAEYRRARSDIEKRDICLKAIDAGLVRRGDSIDLISELCGNDVEFSQSKVSDGRLSVKDVAHFEPPTQAGMIHGQLTSGGYSGWYMIIEHANGKIVRYDFSNVHK